MKPGKFWVYVCSHTGKMNLLLIENQKKLPKNNKELGKEKKKKKERGKEIQILFIRYNFNSYKALNEMQEVQIFALPLTFSGK